MPAAAPPSADASAHPPSTAADQICVNSNIDDVLRLYTKAAIIACNSESPPEDMVEWSRQWFVARCEEQRASAAAKGQ